MIFILLFCLIVIFLITYCFTRKIFSPGCLLVASYIISVYLAILNIEKWQVNLSKSTVNLIIIGVLSFVIPSIITTLLYLYKKNSEKSKKEITQIDGKIIKVDKLLITILLIIQIFSSVLYVFWCSKSLGTNLNIGNFITKMNEYRELKMIDDDSIFEIPFFVKQLVKIGKAIIFCYTFVIINNLVISKKQRIKYKIPYSWFIMILFFLVQTIFSASRFDIAILISYSVTLFYLIFFNGNATTREKINIKLIVKAFALIVVLGLLFFSTKELFGRNSDKTNIEYISSYFGGSIELLDLYMKEPTQKSDIWGKETFFSLNNSFLKKSSEAYTIHLEFRRSNGIWIGNVYTALRMYYQDFGMIGVIILQTVYSVIMTLLFLNVLNNNQEKMPMTTLVYCIISFTLFLHSYRDFFYSTIVSVNYLNIFVYVIIIRYLFVNVKFKQLR